MNKVAKQSTTYGYGHRWDCFAKFANDGLDTTGSSTQHETGTAWWEVDLEHIIKIKDVTLKLGAYPLKHDMFKDVVILTRKTKVGEWTICKEAGRLTSTPSVIICDKPTEARYVRVALKSKNRLYLAEVEVHGFPGKRYLLV